MRTFSPPFQSLLESRYFHGRKRFPFLIGWADCKPRPVKLPKSFVKPPFYFPCISIISISISPVHKRRETNLWQHKIKHGSGGDKEVSAFLAIYSEGFRSCWEDSQQLLLKPVPNGEFGWQYALWSCLRPASKPKAEEVTSAASFA